MAKTDEAPKTSEQPPISFVLAFTIEELTDLNTMLNELPGKYCNPLFNFFNGIAEKRKAEQAVQPKTKA